MLLQRALLLGAAPHDSSARFGGSFPPILRFETFEIHKVFLHVSNLGLTENLSPNLLAESCGAALEFITKKGQFTMVTIQKAAPCSKGSVASITLENANGMRVTLLSYGATIQSILVPDKDGRMTDVLLGYDRAADYEVNSGYLGACIGRNGNRIAGAAFCLNGRHYTLTTNEGKNQLHGGLCGFDKKIWSYTCREDSVEFTTVLADGEEGFPGRMEVAITFTLDDENGLHIDYRAVSDRDTVANFTNHAYFNLNGHGSGDILGHTLQLQASAFTPADEHTMPTGEITPVDGTCMDFRAPKTIGSGIHDPLLKPFGGYDNNFCLDGSGLRKVAEAAGDKSGIVMDVETTLEGVQLYTANFLSDRTGKGGAHYGPFGGFCLETQHYPDAINQPAFPSPVLRRGEQLHETTIYRFGVRK